MLHYQGLPYVSKVIHSELISRHHNDPLAGHFDIEKTCKLVAKKYYWPTLRRGVEANIKGYDVCLTLKAIRHKQYGDFQLLPVPTYRWKNLSIDFVTGLPISADWKDDNYDSILVIVDQLTKMVHYELFKVTIDASGLTKVIIDVVICHHGVLESIVTDWGLLFTSKFWSLLCYFLDIKKSYPLPSTLKQTARPRDKTERWKHTSEHLSIGSKTTRQGYYQWRSFSITTPRMPAPVIFFSSSIVATTPEFFSKRILTPT